MTEADLLILMSKEAEEHDDLQKGDPYVYFAIEQ